MWKTPDGLGGPETPIGPTDTVRLVTNDFMYTGGDGYTVFAQGTDVLQPGDDLLQVAIDYITAHSPVDPQVEGRIVGPPRRRRPRNNAKEREPAQRAGSLVCSWETRPRP